MTIENEIGKPIGAQMVKDELQLGQLVTPASLGHQPFYNNPENPLIAVLPKELEWR